jgi:hypothetical protein
MVIIRMELTSTPNNPVWPDFVEYLLGVLVTFDIVEAADEDPDLAWLSFAQGFNLCCLGWISNDGSDVPRTSKHFGCHE